MCGIAGMIDLAGDRPAPPGAVPAMARTIVHRGPDEDGFLDRPGLHLANRRLSIVGLADGKQPISNEDRTVWTVFNGELFDYPEKRAELEAKGHVFRTHTDTELIPHLWEEYGDKMFDHLRGQYAICLWDSRDKTVILARDRAGICPLFYTVRRHDGADWFVFGSEVKALLASGVVPAEVDPTGLNHVFSFFAVPGPATCFKDVTQLLPGRYLRFRLGRDTTPEQATKQRIYWQVSYPDAGQEDYGSDERRVLDGYEQVLLAAVQKRLRADVPVVSYLSGGVDSSLIVAMANKVLGRPIPTFTVAVQAKGLSEESEALATAKHLGCQPVTVPCGPDELRGHYPELIEAAEAPIIDTSCLGLMHLARAVHDRGYKVALTGEGADEWLAGYSWHKINRIVGMIGSAPSMWVRRAIMRLTGQPGYPKESLRRLQQSVGGHNGWLDVYGLMSMNKLRFFNPELRAAALARSVYDDLELAPDLHRWHPFHRELYLGSRIHLPGHLLSNKGDRVAMHSSVETRYAFLDEEVIAYTSKLHPRWKLRGLLGDKFIERKVAERWLPKEVAWRRKFMFRAPMDSFAKGSADGREAWIDQVLSPESLKRTGFFDPAAVADARKTLSGRGGGVARVGLEMGLTAVASTQLWHHLFVSGNLADVQSQVNKSQVASRPAEPAA